MVNKPKNTFQTSGLVEVERGEKHIEDVTRRHVLEANELIPLEIGTNLPSVLNGKFFEALNTGAQNIDDFINGSLQQHIHILGDGFSTVVNGTLIFTNTGANKLLLANRVYRFTMFKVTGPPTSHKWVEDI